MRVTAWDPAADAEENLRSRVADVWPILERLGMDENASPDNLHFAPSLAEAVCDAEFIQENTPERSD